MDGCKDGRYFGSAAGPRGVGVWVARDVMVKNGMAGEDAVTGEGQVMASIQ